MVDIAYVVWMEAQHWICLTPSLPWHEVYYQAHTSIVIHYVQGVHMLASTHHTVHVL